MSKPLVVLRAPILTLSGYGQHARQIGDWLLTLERAGQIELLCEALFWGSTSWIVDQHRDDLTGELMRRCKAVPRQPDVSIQLQLPNEWNPKLAKRNIGVTAAVETDRAPLDWVACCEAMDRVVFPSVHSMKSITNAGWTPRDGHALVIPESFPDELLGSIDTSALDPLPPFTFLVFGQMTAQEQPNCDRKNIHNTIKWMLEEFVGDPDVGLLIKTNLGRNSVFDAYHTENALIQIRKAVEGASAKSQKELPPIHFVHGDMRPHEIAALYKHPHVKAFVTATRGEGFGLPILEAAACDLPVIATAWSAHREFMELGRYIDLPCSLTPIPRQRVDGRIFADGSRWAEVSEADFKRRVRKYRESSAIPREWARDLGKKIRSKYCRESVLTEWEKQLGEFVRTSN